MSTVPALMPSMVQVPLPLSYTLARPSLEERQVKACSTPWLLPLALTPTARSARSLVPTVTSVLVPSRGSTMMLAGRLLIVTRYESLQPLSVCAIRRTWPARTPVSLPSASTVAAPVMGSTDQITSSGCAPMGYTVALNCVCLPTQATPVSSEIDTEVGS